MRPADAGQPFPSHIPSPLAWDAFDRLFHGVDWRLRLEGTDPLALSVEHDDRFDHCRSGAASWKGFDQAAAWISNRILDLAKRIDRTCVRRLHLQVPATPAAPDAAAFLARLKAHLQDLVRNELVTHFDASIPEWERLALDLTSRVEDTAERRRLERYLGLDQRISVDAARKAIQFIFFRTHWHLQEADGRSVLVPDWRFERYCSLRASLDEQTRARSLVARCVERLCNEHELACRRRSDVAPLTRARLKAEVERRFAEEGVWGLIHLALPWDRARYDLSLPPALDERVRQLVARQEGRLIA